jgi:hypothetical protein
MAEDDEKTPREGTAVPPKPVEAELPKAPPGTHRLKLYSPIWRGDPGDSVRGAIVGAQPNELPDGEERTCVMLQLASPATCIVFDERGDREEELKPVARIGLESSQIISACINGPALARLVAYADQPDHSQVVTLHAIAPKDGGGVRNPVTGKRVRYLCFLDDVPAKRSEVDPAEMMRLELARKAAAEAQRR